MTFGDSQVDSRTDHASPNQVLPEYKITQSCDISPAPIARTRKCCPLISIFIPSPFFVEGSSPPFASVQTTLS